MRATALLVKNVLGIREIRIDPGQITRLSGRNESGKSSILDALKAAIGGGNLMNLKRVGVEDDPEVVLVLDNGRYRIERKGDDTVVKQRVGDTAAYEEIRRPQTWLNSLFDPYGSNPLTFLNARPMDRADILLEVLPLELDRKALMAAIGEAWPAGTALPEGHPLTVLAFAHDTLFDERTGVNRSQKDKASSAYELQKALPAEMPDDPVNELAKAAGARDALFKKRADKQAAAETAEGRALAAAAAAYEQEQTRVEGEFKAAAAKLRLALSEKVAELERQIAMAKAEAETAIAAKRAEGQEELAVADAALERVEAEAAAARKAAFAEVEAMQPDLQAAEQHLAELAALSKNVAQLQEQKRLADRFQKESDDLKAVSERLTQAIEAVDVFKAQLLKGLPIDGLEIRGKEIFVNDIPFDQLNHGQRIKIAVKVAMLRAKGQALPLVFVDGAESLDPERRKLLEDELVASGIQAFVAYREDGDLKVETRDVEPTKVAKMPPPKPQASKRQRSLVE